MLVQDVLTSQAPLTGTEEPEDHANDTLCCNKSRSQLPPEVLELLEELTQEEMYVPYQTMKMGQES